MQARTWICWIVILICSAASPLLAEPDFRIGVSAPLTGPAAAWGNDFRNVLIFANEKLAGGRYKLIVEDDRCDPKEAVTIAHKFSAGQGLKYVFVVAGTVTLASAPIYGRAGVLVMAPIVTPRAVSKLGDYIFRTTPGDTLAASMLAGYISRSHKRVAVLTEGSEYSVGFLEDFSGNSKRLGLAVINEHYAPGETDFRANLLKLKAGHPEALFINANTEASFALILKQARDLDLGVPVFGAYLPGSSTFLKLSGSQAEGIVFTDYPLPRSVMKDSGRALYEEFVTRFGPLQGFEYTFPAVFEAFRAFHEAVNSGKVPKEFLHSHEFDGIFGRFSFDQNGDIQGVKPALKVIRNATAVLVN